MDFKYGLQQQCLCHLDHEHELKLLLDSNRNLPGNCFDEDDKYLIIKLSTFKNLLKDITNHDVSLNICSCYVDFLTKMKAVNHEIFASFLKLLDDKNVHLRYGARKCIPYFLMMVNPDSYIKKLVNNLKVDRVSFMAGELFCTMESVMRLENNGKKEEVHFERLEPMEVKKNSFESVSSGSHRKCVRRFHLLPSMIAVNDLKKTLVSCLSVEWKNLIEETLTSSHPTEKMHGRLLQFLSLWESIVEWLNGANWWKNEFHVFYNLICEMFPLDHDLKSQLVSHHVFNIVHKTLNFVSVISENRGVTSSQVYGPSYLVNRAVLHKYHSLEFWSKRHWIEGRKCCFTGANIADHDSGNDSYDYCDFGKSLLRRLIMIVMESVALQARKNPLVSSDYDNLTAFKDFLTNRPCVNILANSHSDFSRLIIEIFMDEDNVLVECLLFCLEIYVNSDVGGQYDIVQSLHPDLLFFEFIRATGYDYQVLLDLLVNDETQFLLYLIKYLKVTMLNATMFKSQVSADKPHCSRDCQEICINSSKCDTIKDESCTDCSSNEEIGVNDKLSFVYSLLGELLESITRLHEAKLFPYNPKPLLKLLVRVIETHSAS